MSHDVQNGLHEFLPIVLLRRPPYVHKSLGVRHISQIGLGLREVLHGIDVERLRELWHQVTLRVLMLGELGEIRHQIDIGG
jgi:hypothetical protein